MSSLTLLGTGGHGPGGPYDSTTYYSNVGLGRCATNSQPFTTESYVSQIIHVPGHISYLSWGLDTAFGAALTFSLNRNSSSTALAIAIGALTTGWVTDNTDSVYVSSGDGLDFAVAVSSAETTYSGSFYCASAQFAADTGSAQLLATVGRATISPGSTPLFANFLGILGENATERYAKFKCLAEGTWQNMACHIESNAFDRTTTITNRINGGDGSMAIHIPEGASGRFEDGANSDSVSPGDLLDYQIVASENGNGESLIMDWIGAHFLASTVSQCMIGGGPDASEIIFPNDTYYTSLFGAGNTGTRTGVTRATGLVSFSLTASNYTNYVTDGQGTGGATFTLLKNGSAALAVSSSNGAMGYIADSAAATFAVGDNCANEIVGGTALVGIYWASASLLLQST